MRFTCDHVCNKCSISLFSSQEQCWNKHYSLKNSSDCSYHIHLRKSLQLALLCKWHLKGSSMQNLEKYYFILMPITCHNTFSQETSAKDFWIGIKIHNNVNTKMIQRFWSYFAFHDSLIIIHLNPKNICKRQPSTIENDENIVLSRTVLTTLTILFILHAVYNCNGSLIPKKWKWHNVQYIAPYYIPNIFD